MSELLESLPTPAQVDVAVDEALDEIHRVVVERGVGGGRTDLRSILAGLVRKAAVSGVHYGTVGFERVQEEPPPSEGDRPTVGVERPSVAPPKVASRRDGPGVRAARFASIHGTPFRKGATGHLVCLVYKEVGLEALSISRVARVVAGTTGGNTRSVEHLIRTCGMFASTSDDGWGPTDYLAPIIARTSSSRMAKGSGIPLARVRSEIAIEFGSDVLRPAKPRTDGAPPPPSGALRAPDATNRATTDADSVRDILLTVLSTAVPDGLTLDQLRSLSRLEGNGAERIEDILSDDPSFESTAGRWRATHEAMGLARLEGLTPDVVRVPGGGGPE